LEGQRGLKYEVKRSREEEDEGIILQKGKEEK
jgi:hypothetical protein